MCTEDSICSHREFQRAAGYKPLSLGHPIASAPGGIGVCCHSHNRRGYKDIYGAPTQTSQVSLAGLQGASRTSAGYSSSTEHTVQRTARHPGAEVKDPPCHPLGRQAGGKLQAELPGTSAARRELPELFGTPAVRETGKELGVFSRAFAFQSY